MLHPIHRRCRRIASWPQAAECLELYCDRLARALAGVINLIDPHVIVLGGGLSKMTPLYRRVPAAQRIMRAGILPSRR